MTTYHADICPVCGYRLKINLDGTMAKHWYKNTKADGVCGGSYRVPIHRKTRKNTTVSLYSEETEFPKSTRFKVVDLGALTPEPKPNVLERIIRIWRK